MQVSLHNPKRYPKETFADYRERRRASQERVRTLKTGIGPASNWPAEKDHRRRWSGWASHRMLKRLRMKTLRFQRDRKESTP